MRKSIFLANYGVTPRPKLLKNAEGTDTFVFHSDTHSNCKSYSKMNPKWLIDCFDDDGTFMDVSYVRSQNGVATEELNALLEECDSIAETESESVRQSRRRR